MVSIVSITVLEPDCFETEPVLLALLNWQSQHIERALGIEGLRA
jgi:hypothetical protein